MAQIPINGFGTEQIKLLLLDDGYEASVDNRIFFIEAPPLSTVQDGVALYPESSATFPDIDCNKIAICWSAQCNNPITLNRIGNVWYKDFVTPKFIQLGETTATKSAFASVSLQDYLLQKSLFFSDVNSVAAIAHMFYGQVPGIGLIDLVTGELLDENWVPVVKATINGTKYLINLNVAYGLYPSAGDKNSVLSDFAGATPTYNNSINDFIAKNGYSDRQFAERTPPYTFRFFSNSSWHKTIKAEHISMVDVRSIVDEDTLNEFLSGFNGNGGVPTPLRGGTYNGYYYSAGGMYRSEVLAALLSIYKVARFYEGDVYELGNPEEIKSHIETDIPTVPQPPYTPDGGGSGGAGLPSGSGGGGGSFPSDPGPSLVDRIPNGQTGNDIAQSGLFTMYLMNQQYMNLMGEILWEDNIGIQAAKEIFGNPINTVISTISYPFNLLNLVQYVAQNLYFGQWKTDLIFQALTKSSFQIDWGTISIPFAWGNFLDYAPHTKMELFLPWGPGYVTIDPNEVSPFSNTAGDFNVGGFTAGSIQVKTNVELGKGTCVHNVIGNNGRVIGSYSGIVGKQVPITALDTGGKVLTTVAAVATGSVGLATAAGAMSGKFNTGQITTHKQIDPLLNRPLYGDVGYMHKASEGVSGIDRGANLASSALMSHPITFPRAGTFSDGSSAMTVQTPFLIISRPVQSVPTQYGHYNGYPSNIYYHNFSNISGYTEISEIHLDNVTATADELQELDTILKGGILL